MTWLQLYEQIRAMTPEEKLLPVRIRMTLPFQDVFREVNIERSDKAYLLEGEDNPKAGVIRKGEPYLW